MNTSYNQQKQKQKEKQKSSISSLSENYPKLLITNQDLKPNDFFLFLRSGLFFDAVYQRKTIPKFIEISTVVKNGKYIITVRRPENTILHQRLFEAMLILGKLQDNKKLYIKNVYELKKLAGIDLHTSAKKLIKMFEEIQSMIIRVEKIVEEYNIKEIISFSPISRTEGVITYDDQKANSMSIQLSEEFLLALQKLNVIKIPKEILFYITKNVQSAYVEKIVKFFLTQDKPLHWNIWNLLQQIADYPKNEKTKLQSLSDRSKRNILKEIEDSEEFLKQFGLTFNRKTLLITFNPNKSQHKALMGLNNQYV